MNNLTSGWTVPRFAGLALIVGSLALAVGSCTRDVDAPMDPGPGVLAVPDSVQTVFDNNCLGGCHAGPGTPGGSLDLSDAVTSYANLVNVPSNSCGPLVHIEPFDSDASCNNIRMQDAARPMPPGGLISQDQIDIVVNWTNEGALPADTAMVMLTSPRR